MIICTFHQTRYQSCPGLYSPEDVGWFELGIVLVINMIFRLYMNFGALTLSSRLDLLLLENLIIKRQFQ